MSWLERLKARLFGYEIIEPEGVMPTVKCEGTSGGEAKTCRTEDESPDAFKRVLIVCSGNICRSAYGAVKFEQLLKARGEAMRVASAGTLRLVGRSAAPEMIAAADERGLNLTHHRSSALSKPLIEAADVIFAMEAAHRDEIVRICPACESRIVMLGQCLPEPKPEILDPMGQEPTVYREVADEIDLALETWFERSKVAKSGDV